MDFNYYLIFYYIVFFFFIISCFMDLFSLLKIMRGFQINFEQLISLLPCKSTFNLNFKWQSGLYKTVNLKVFSCLLCSNEQQNILVFVYAKTYIEQQLC